MKNIELKGWLEIVEMDPSGFIYFYRVSLSVHSLPWDTLSDLFCSCHPEYNLCTSEIIWQLQFAVTSSINTSELVSHVHAMWYFLNHEAFLSLSLLFSSFFLWFNLILFSYVFIFVLFVCFQNYFFQNCFLLTSNLVFLLLGFTRGPKFYCKANDFPSWRHFIQKGVSWL